MTPTDISVSIGIANNAAIKCKMNARADLIFSEMMLAEFNRKGQ